MSYSLFPFIKPHFHDGSGQLATGYMLYAFDGGTTNPIAIYKDSAGSATYGVSLILNGRGEPDGEGIYLDNNFTYKFILKNLDGDEVWSVDNIIPNGSSTVDINMDTIAQGALWKKLSLDEYNKLTSGLNTTIHFHAEDRVWTNITGKPTTFPPTGHVNSHQVGGSDVISHNQLDDLSIIGDVSVSDYKHISDAQFNSIPDDATLVHNIGDETIAGVKSFVDSIYLKTSMYLQAEPSTPFETEEFSVYVGGGYASSYLRTDATNLPHDNINQFVGDSSTSTSWSHTSASNQAQVYVAPDFAKLQLNRLGQSASLECLNDSGVDQSDVSLTAGAYSIAIQVREDGTKILNGSGAGSDTLLLPAPSNLTRTFAMTDQVAMAYNITQGVASLVWTVNHNLGVKPIIQTWNSAGDQIIGTIHHVNVNQATVTFASSQSGAGRCV